MSCKPVVQKGTDLGQARDFAILKKFIDIWSRKGIAKSQA